MQKVPAIFEDSTGTVARLTGEIEFPDGSPVNTSREQLNGNSVTIANGANAKLTWDAKLLGSDLLDITTPSDPKVVAAGVYAVSVIALPTAITVGGYYELQLLLDSGGDAAGVLVTSPASIAADVHPVMSCSATYFIPAGGVINAVVFNFDGTASADFSLNLGVVQAL